MQLGLTFPLQRKLKIKSVPYGAPLDRRFCWDLHCITLRGQDSLLLVHCASRYTIVACGVSGLEWARLPDFALEQIRAGLLDAGMDTAADSGGLSPRRRSTGADPHPRAAGGGLPESGLGRYSVAGLYGGYRCPATATAGAGGEQHPLPLRRV